MKPVLALILTMLASISANAVDSSCEAVFVTGFSIKPDDLQKDLQTLTSKFSFGARKLSPKERKELTSLLRYRVQSVFEATTGHLHMPEKDGMAMDRATTHRIKWLLSSLPARYQNNPRIQIFREAITKDKNDEWFSDPANIGAFLWLTHPYRVNRLAHLAQIREHLGKAQIDATGFEGSFSNYFDSGRLQINGRLISEVTLASLASMLRPDPRADYEARNVWLGQYLPVRDVMNAYLKDGSIGRKFMSRLLISGEVKGLHGNLTGRLIDETTSLLPGITYDPAFIESVRENLNDHRSALEAGAPPWAVQSAKWHVRRAPGVANSEITVAELTALHVLFLANYQRGFYWYKDSADGTQLLAALHAIEELAPYSKAPTAVDDTGSSSNHLDAKGLIQKVGQMQQINDSPARK